ncbi:MAG: STAS domain-containing protein [Acidobacteriales bacterium]|nr:STAS domain-containing protein [Terriglobales bacterium]
MAFAVQVLNMGEFVSLRCVGRLIFDEGTNALRAAVISQRARKIFLDLAGVEAIDAAGVGTLAGLHEQVENSNGTLIVARPNQQVLSVLRVTKADSVLNLHLEEPRQQDSFWLRALAPWRASSFGT